LRRRRSFTPASLRGARLPIAAGLLLLTWIAPVLCGADESEPYDLLIRGAQVIDGSGAAGAVADVGIRKGRIAAVGDLRDSRATKSIDAKGLVLCPGFVDLHSHADRTILELRDAENYVRQGVTTLVVGNCGSSPVDAAAFFRGLHDGGAGVNIVLLIGHGSVRVAEVGDRNVAPTAEQLAGMQRRVGQMMEAGAVGLSTGLRYRPGAYADTKEVIAVAREIAPYGGFYATHMRDEGEQIMEALEEALTIGREAKTPVHVSHHKISSASVWGLTRLTLARIDQARAGGMDVTLDHYPYGAGSSGISLMVPQPLVAGGPQAFRERIAGDDERRRVLEAVEQDMRLKLFERGQDPKQVAHLRAALARIQVASLSEDTKLEGKNLAEILDLRGTPLSLRAGAELIVELVGRGAGAIYHTIDDREGGDVDRVMQHAQTCFASDGVVPQFGEGHPHPRSYGTYPRVLARYVRERGLLTWEAAIHKMTGLPARRLGWTDRGLVKPGHWADLVLLDPERIRDAATFAAPHQHAEGVVHVLIGGEPVLEAGRMTTQRPGRPVYSVPVADSAETKLRRDVVELLSQHDGRFGVLAATSDGREVFAFAADERFFLGPAGESREKAELPTLREAKVRDVPPTTTGSFHWRPHVAEEKAGGKPAGAESALPVVRRLDAAAITHVRLPDGRTLHVIAAYVGLPEDELAPASDAMQRQLSKLIYDYAAR
jgi:dihydroorotase/N-acyl-D-amino-acid deacylase